MRSVRAKGKQMRLDRDPPHHTISPALARCSRGDVSWCVVVVTGQLQLQLRYGHPSVVVLVVVVVIVAFATAATASALRRLIYHTPLYVYVWCMCVLACVLVYVYVLFANPPLPPKTHCNVVYDVSTAGYDLNSSCRRRLSQKGTKCD